MKRALTWLSPEMAPPARPHALLEEEAYARGFRCVAGLDEAGRGPLAGPVVAGAVVFPRGISHPQINDSKLLSAKVREALVPWIKGKALAWGLGIVGPAEIDRMNILSASLLAMAEALRHMNPVPDYLLIDGNQEIPVEFLKAIGNRQESLVLAPSASSLTLSYPHASRLTPRAFPFQRAIKKGDRLSISIAAASILAKVARDEIMTDYDRRYPEYGFGGHKGYASPSHLAALSRYGPSPIHRRSFSPIRESPKAAFGGEGASSQLKF